MLTNQRVWLSDSDGDWHRPLNAFIGHQKDKSRPLQEGSSDKEKTGPPLALPMLKSNQLRSPLRHGHVMTGEARQGDNRYLTPTALDAATNLLWARTQKMANEETIGSVS